MKVYIPVQDNGIITGPDRLLPRHPVIIYLVKVFSIGRTYSRGRLVGYVYVFILNQLPRANVMCFPHSQSILFIIKIMVCTNVRDIFHFKSLFPSLTVLMDEAVPFTLLSVSAFLMSLAESSLSATISP